MFFCEWKLCAHVFNYTIVTYWSFDSSKSWMNVVNNVITNHVEYTILAVLQRQLCPVAIAMPSSSHRRCFIEKGVLKNVAKFTGKQLWPEACNFMKKETLARVFSCEFCEFFKNNYFTEHLWTTASFYHAIFVSFWIYWGLVKKWWEEGGWVIKI